MFNRDLVRCDTRPMDDNPALTSVYGPPRAFADSSDGCRALTQGWEHRDEIPGAHTILRGHGFPCDEPSYVPRLSSRRETLKSPIAQRLRTVRYAKLDILAQHAS